MTAHRRVIPSAAAAALLAIGLPAQEPPAPQPPQQQEPKEQPPAPEQQPIDPAKAAAEILRKRLGLKPGPEGQPPKGPAAKPAEAETPANTTEQQPPSPVAPATGVDEPAPQEPGVAPQGQEPKPQQPADPTEAAKRALEKLLPGAKPPEVAPIPTEAGTPEPVLPGHDVAPAAPQAAALPPESMAFHGVLSSRYRGRRGNGTGDQDLVTRLGLDFGDAERDPFTAHFSGRLFNDLDGQTTDGTFNGLDQSLGDDWNARLYEAHVDAHELPNLDVVRLGRQDLIETPTPVTFDGLRADTERFGPAKVSFSAYGGVTVHHFESASSGDSVYGMASELRPWQDARVRLDWMSLHDEFLTTDRHDELYGVRWWQDLSGVNLHGLHTWRDGKPRDLHLGAEGGLDLPVTFAVDYRELLTTQRAAVTELDPFYEIAAEYQPYRQLDANVGTDLGDHVTVNTGGAIRRLRDSNDEGEFNREFERAYGDLELHAFGIDGLSVTVTGNYYNTQGEDFRTVTGDLEYRPDQQLRILLGTGYDLYLYDSFDDRERVHVRSFYLRTDYRIGKRVRLDAAYEYERDDEDEFHLFRMGVIWTL
ncbi:MAG: hypothetical protein H6838_13695 [Planctomycetes bacterium]|nr:hypothetical protein [Planctomycetota bacterium]MCB9886542.1 hypothetical protein [Planctomycetota bacterium]